MDGWGTGFNPPLWSSHLNPAFVAHLTLISGLTTCVWRVGAASGQTVLPHLVRADGDSMLITECASTAQTLGDCSTLGTPTMCIQFVNSENAVGACLSLRCA